MPAEDSAFTTGKDAGRTMAMACTHGQERPSQCRAKDCERRGQFRVLPIRTGM
ncbi:MAG: hypothetical protein IPO04_20775 [Cytophagaceae bacterium]|nr:hypothetical protein [Cytophagaceae bacterium]